LTASRDLTFAIAAAPFAWSVIARIVRGELQDRRGRVAWRGRRCKVLDRLGKFAQPA
jgi:hypothetical protein